MVNDVWQLTVRAEQAGQQIENVLHFQEGSAVAVLDGLLETFRDEVIPVWRQAVSVSLNYQKLSLRKLNPVPLDPTEMILSAGNGTRTGAATPPQCAVVASIRTGQGGRSARGRVYFGGVAVGDTSDGQLIPASVALYQAAIQKVLDTFPDSIGPSGWIFGVYSRKEGYVPPNYSTSAFRAATSAVVNPLVATQRRRGRLG